MQEHGRHEHRQGDPQQGKAHEKTVRQPVFAHGADKAAGNPQRPGEQRREQRQDQGVDKGASYQLGHWLSKGIAGAEVPADRSGDIAEELTVERLIQAQLRGHTRHGGGIRVLPHHGLNRVAGYDAQHHKGDQHDAGQHDQRLGEALRDAPSHFSTTSAA